ncbi:hypothetical protein CB0940_03643 [Cercospora beticola]|uniref:Uncharacterized protein n=1 Tax=Cercospora beticola TaxID=122368 RepID=A0A2G5I5Z0_CERBT|nr:hypothetical protein CB0940_03643 [Cercospora beticola]PIB00211.1 hypothetical protein CB0940_03643 [Cercospora beticola]WPB00822.1 hypothetical protein RHO25_005442 [Cercospora beticola]
METMTANFPHPPLAAVSPSTHLPQSQSPSPRAQKATRTVHTQPEHSQHHHNQHHHHHHPTLSAPASQESMVSVQSSYGSSVPHLQGSESNLSTQTDLTSPSSSLGLKHILTNVTPASHDATQTTTQDIYRPRNKTPENARHSPTHTAEHALYSPMSITSPVATNGAKRTASGHVKNASSIHTSPYRVQFPERGSRRESVSSSGSKAGEIAATLKARLGYAMAKVQNGWEHKSLAEVEQLAAQRHRSRTSVSQIDQQRPGTSGLSNGASRLSMYDQYGRTMLDMTEAPPSKRTSGNYSQYQAQLQSQLQQHQQHFASQSTTPRLQPAPDIRPTSSQRGGAYSGPILQPLPQHVSNAMSPPRTPISATSPQRPPTIRTQTQTAEAEREALQALFQLGSPHTSVGPHIPRTGTATTNSSQSQMSPARQPDLTPRHATFVRSESASTSSSSGLDPTSSHALQESRTRLIEQLADQ